MSRAYFEYSVLRFQSECLLAGFQSQCLFLKQALLEARVRISRSKASLSGNLQKVGLPLKNEGRSLALFLSLSLPLTLFPFITPYLHTCIYIYMCIYIHKTCLTDPPVWNLLYELQSTFLVNLTDMDLCQRLEQHLAFTSVNRTPCPSLIWHPSTPSTAGNSCCPTAAGDLEWLPQP